ncbi:hypothetical protein T4B_8273 [Trichinella pseudospiralis]|uniref:Uncharacterized protein n=1 Tax=Trichinella pseudospiralis TaxID=6337 RepID=A0A0V1HE60_TRIPS|nr:hypothetical protein T4A_7386 [Trichinella pseudospiralis]KRZ08697.1 hypothetical protein T4B_8273 [Trichinella pseudospiralis]KRZ28865.1 hypothetical protein T4C_12485 [Trichinella pseudospiralis]
MKSSFALQAKVSLLKTSLNIVHVCDLIAILLAVNPSQNLQEVQKNLFLANLISNRDIDIEKNQMQAIPYRVAGESLIFLMNCTPPEIFEVLKVASVCRMKLESSKMDFPELKGT